MASHQHCRRLGAEEGREQSRSGEQRQVFRAHPWGQVSSSRGEVRRTARRVPAPAAIYPRIRNISIFLRLNTGASGYRADHQSCVEACSKCL